MNTLFKIATIVLGTSISTSVFAFADDLREHGAFWLTGTYSEPSNNGASYGDIIQGPSLSPVFDGARRHAFVDPDMVFDYGLGFSYHIEGSHTRVFVSYDHFSEDNDTTNGNIRDLGLPFPPQQLGIGGPTSEWAHLTNHSDELRIGLSHRKLFGPQFRLDLLGFMEWDSLKRSLDEQIRQTVNFGEGGIFNAFFTRNTYSKANGWGPGLGANVKAIPFRCYPHFGVFVNGNTSLLWTENTYQILATDNLNRILFDYSPEESESLVSKIDASFGVTYSRRLREFSDSIFEVALGVRYLNMFNVFKNGNTFYNPIYNDSSNINYAANLGYAEDWGRVGPFLTLKLGGVHS